MQEIPESPPKSTPSHILRTGSFRFHLVQSCKKTNILLLQWIFYWLQGRGAVKQHQILECPRKIWINRQSPAQELIPLFTNHNAKCLMNKAVMEQVRSGKWEIGNPVPSSATADSAGPGRNPGPWSHLSELESLLSGSPQLWSCFQQSNAHFCMAEARNTLLAG